MTTVLSIALVATTLDAPAAYADDDVIEIPISSLPSIVITHQPGDPLAITGITLPPVTVGQSVPVATQCTPIPEQPSNLCIGHPTTGPSEPLVVQGIEDLAGVIKAGPEAESALGWMVAEAVESIRITYGLPNDERILRYARPQVRSYLVSRLLDIMDRKVHGIALNADEQRALDFVQAEYAEEDRILAQAARDEFDRFMSFGSGGCGYSPPAPPPGTPFPALKLPKAVSDACKYAKPQTAVMVDFVPPIPSVDDFTTWGSYRAAQSLGLDAYANDVVRQNTANLTVALTTAGAIAGAIGAGGITAAVVGSSTAIASAVIGAIGSHALATTWVAGVGPVAGTAFGVGAAAAASVVAIVVLAVIVTAISIWMVVQRDSVGTDLTERLDKALANKDPLGLKPLVEKYSGQELRSSFSPGNLPAYRSDKAVGKLANKVVEWTTITSDGTAIGDPTGLWPGNATTDQDRRFIVRTGSGPETAAASITVPQDTGEATIRFSRDWLVVSKTGQPAKPDLTFAFKDLDGVVKLATRSPTGNGWIVGATENGTFSGTEQESISFRNADNEVVRVRLQPKSTELLSGPRPAAVGPLYAGRTVILRPNPVNLDGSSVDLQLSMDDYTYDWNVRRFDPTSGQWVTVTAPTGTYGPSFVPSVTGRYQAEVKMTALGQPDVVKYGLVEFTITAPPMNLTTFALLDNGVNNLEIDLQLTQPVPSGTVTATVEWQPALGSSNRPTTTVQLSCVQTGPLECTTPRTSLLDTLTRTLTSQTDLRQPIVVTLTNNHGASIRRELRTDGSQRPSIAAPDPANNAGAPGSVSVSEAATSVVVPLRSDGYSNYQVATMVPSEGEDPGFTLVDPASGTVRATMELPDSGGMYATVVGGDELWIYGVPTWRDLGSYEIPIGVQDSGGARNVMVLQVNIVPSTQDRFRAALLSDIDPSDFAIDHVPEMYATILGGHADEPAYSGQYCVSLAYLSAGPPVPRTLCGPQHWFFDAETGPQPFPFDELYPEGLQSGQYRATAWLADAGPRTDTAALTESFLLTTDQAFPEPAVLIDVPTVSGTPVVGGQLKAAVSTFPATATTSFQWRRDGVPIPGAVGATYTPGAADVGARLSVRATATAPGYAAASATSAATEPVAEGTLDTPAPAVSGTAKVGATLTATAPVAAGVGVAYQWRRDGTAISGATGSSYTAVPEDLGTRLSVRVTASSPGYASATATSAPTAPVVRGTLSPVPRPKVKGKNRVGKVVKVVPGTWQPGVRLRFRWYAGGKAIKGATKKKLRLTAAMKGEKIKVRVTATLTGYDTVTRTARLKKRVT